MRLWIEELGRAWRSLVVAPMVSVLSFMTLALPVAADMLVQGSTRPSNIDPGFEPGGVARVQVHLPGKRLLIAAIGLIPPRLRPGRGGARV